MFSIEELAFAVKYPFTKKARQIIKDYDISVEKITEEQLEKAVQRLSLRKNQVEFNSIEFMVEELQFFALEKLLLSLSNNNSLKKSFAKQIASNSTNQIKKNDEKKALQLIESILEEYGVKTGFINGFYAIPLIDFLKASYFSESLNLVHQRVDKGKVILSYNALLLFLEYYLVNRMINSMESAIPKELLNNNIKKAIKKVNSVSFYEPFSQDGKTVPLTTKVNLNAFPECMQGLYSRLIAGENLPHMERFFLVCFLVQIGMEEENILNSFRRTPNFNENLSRYHIKNIKSKGYSSPSSDKLRTHGIQCACKNPLFEYKNNLKKLKSGSNGK